MVYVDTCDLCLKHAFVCLLKVGKGVLSVKQLWGIWDAFVMKHGRTLYQDEPHDDENLSIKDQHNIKYSKETVDRNTI